MRISDWSSDVCSSDLMQNHPLTPMRDANLVRVLQAQSRGKVGLIGINAVQSGVQAVQARIDELRAQGVTLAIADARAEERRVGKACVSTCRSRWSPNKTKQKREKKEELAKRAA